MKHFTPAAAALAICFAHSPAGAQKPVAPASASPRDDGNWTMPAKDYASTRYSELDQIHTGNVRNLQVAFTFPTETLKGQESAVLAVDGTLYFTTIDAHSFALDAESGDLLWKTKVGDFTGGETITMAPLLVKDKMLVGNSGAEFGARGWLAALDRKTGRESWRAYST